MTGEPDPIQHIRRTLDEVRRALVRRAAFEAAALVFPVFVGVLAVAAGVLGWVTPSEGVRAAAWAIAIGSAITVVTYAIVRVQRRYRDDDAVGELVEQKLPEFRTDIRAALDFGTDQNEAREPDAERLRRLLVDRIGRRMRERQSAVVAVIPRRELRERWMAGAVILAFIGVFAGASEAYKSGVSMLVGGIADEPTTATADQHRPVVSTVDLRLTYPSYTGIGQRTIPNSTGDVTAVAGTQVDLIGFTLERVAAASIEIDTPSETVTYALNVTDNRRISGGFNLTDSGSYTFLVELEDGTTIRDPITRRMRVEPDQAPRIELIEPVGNMVVNPGEIIEFQFVASDDFGLTDVSMAYYFAGQEDDVRRLPLHGSSVGRAIEDRAPFDLAPLYLQPRDEVVVYIEATDNNTISGPGVGRSRPISLSVESPEELNQEVLVLKQQLFEDFLVQLGGMLVAPLNEFAATAEGDELVFTSIRGTPPELSEHVRSVREPHAGWPEVLTTFQSLIELMEQDELTVVRDLELLQASYDALYALERDLTLMLDRLSLPADRNSVQQRAFDEVADLNATLVDRTERTTLLLEDLVAAQQAESVERTLEELADVRDRLRDLIEQYQQTNDPFLREQIERELARLEQRMRELMERLASQMQNLPYEHLNMEALQESETMQNVGEMVSAMDQIRQMLDSGDVEGALDALDNLDQTLESMMNEFGSAMDSGGASGLSEFDQEMAELMDQVNDLETAELDLEQATNELQQEMHRQRQEEIREQVEETLDRLRTELDGLQSEMSALEREELSQGNQQTMSELDQGLERMGQMLDQGDIAGAEEQADSMLSRFGDAMRDLRLAESLSRHDPEASQQASEARETTEDGRRAMESMSDELRELMELAQPQPGPGQQQQLDDLAQQQGQVQQQLQQLQEQVGEFSQRFPAGEQLGEPLQQIGESMQQAEQQLRGGRPQPALRGEQDALQGLRQMRQQLQQMTQQQRQQQQQQQRGRTSQEDVEIPEGGEGGRENFRDDVMDAMREESLDAYEDEIRSYYERLMQQ